MPECSRDFQALRQKALQVLDEQQYEDVSRMSLAAMQEVLQELRIHQIELHMQNDELLRARQDADTERDRFSELYDSVPVGCLTVDHSGVILEVNRASTVLLACEKRTLLGRALADFVAPEDQDSRFRLFRQAFKTGRLQQGELSFRRTDGSPFVALVEAQVTPATPPALQTCRVVLSDITVHKQAAAVMRQRDWLQVTLSSIGDGVIAVNTDGRILFLNREAERLTGWTAAEARGARAEDVMRILHEQTPQTLAHPVARVLPQATEGDAVQQAVLLSRDGRALQVASRAAPIRGDDGSLHGVVLICRDVTEHKQLEERLRQSQKMEAIGTLAGGIAHDFNNMLAVILGYAQLASYDIARLSPTLSPTQKYVQQILTAGQRARDLVKQILAFSRQDTTLHRAVPVCLVVKQALTLLRATLPMNIDMQHTADEAAGSVLADATQLQQVVINLCANAGYAMRHTGGVLRVDVDAVEVDATLIATCPDLKAGPYARLTIQDTGPGIAPDILPRIFEPYFTTKAVGEGTGIGLAVVHGIVASHGGAITVHSLPGQGAAFIVYLPRIVPNASASLPPVEGLPRGRECILFIDDNETQARMGQDLLMRLGYDVVCYSSSVKALETFRAAPYAFDLVITDQTMPEMTGEALVPAMRHIRPDMPLILCTGFSHAIDARKAQTLGIDAFVMKPWELGELARTIRQVLAQRSAP